MIDQLLALLAALAAPPIVTGDLPRKHDRPLEDIEGLVTRYGEITTSEGLTLRTLVTRPEGASERLPALFLTQWVSCGTVEMDERRPLAQLVRRAGIALIRVERAGTGDSEGAGCDTLDYDTEVRHYREAFDQLRADPWVDDERIIIIGSSLGSTTAPLVAEGNDVAGVIVQGGGAETYLERMIDFERLFLERSGEYAPEQVHDEMLRRIPFLYQYLVEARSPEDVARDDARYVGLWEKIRGTQGALHYGRPLAWHQQAATHNFAAAWAQIEAPVLVLYGEYDQFERATGHRFIAQTVNHYRPGTATYVEIEGADHGLESYPDPFSAYRYEGGTRNAELFIAPVLDWLRNEGLTP